MGSNPPPSLPPPPLEKVYIVILICTLPQFNFWNPFLFRIDISTQIINPKVYWSRIFIFKNVTHKYCLNLSVQSLIESIFHHLAYPNSTALHSTTLHYPVQIQKTVGREAFPLIEQTFYPNHREMVRQEKKRRRRSLLLHCLGHISLFVLGYN